jgi:hypothetical protein
MASIRSRYRPTSAHRFRLGQAVAFLENLGHPLGMSVAVVADRGTGPVAIRPRFVQVRAGRASGERDLNAEVGLSVRLALRGRMMTDRPVGDAELRGELLRRLEVDPLQRLS